MRKFSSYEEVNTELHYYAPREALIENLYHHLLGEDPDYTGHYITVWAPRQTGKTWLMRQVVRRFKQQDDVEVAILTMQSGKTIETDEDMLSLLVEQLTKRFDRDFPDIRVWKSLSQLFSKPYFTKPLILILDEFDALNETFINKFTNEFRSMYTDRLNEVDQKSAEKSCLLHGVTLIGVRAVLGVENVSGSPFNVQRSVHIPNLTAKEITSMFQWYEQESGQKIDPNVVDQIFYEFQGQPGLTCWFGELLTETYNHTPEQSITMTNFEEAYAAALNLLPNNNILNIVSKARQEPYKDFILEMFQTKMKVRFTYDNPLINFLYLNGVIDLEQVSPAENYVKFSSPFVQKRLFNAFTSELFDYLGQLYDPFEDLSDTVTADSLSIPHLLRRYENYLHQNRDWLLKDAPRRKSDLRIYEAVYHFNFYMYLHEFIRNKGGVVWPEFPTGNGKVDIFIKYQGQIYGLEVKSFADQPTYNKSLIQAARYGKELQLPEIWLALFVDSVDETNRQKYEATYVDEETKVTVYPIFVQTVKV